MRYEDFLEELKIYQEEGFALFQKRLIFTSAQILGVRTPILRKLAKKYVAHVEEFMGFPDEYYEVTFIKLCMVSSLPFDQFINYVERCIPLIDNWSTCDMFKPKCIQKYKKEYLSFLAKFFAHGGEFFERHVLVILLFFYIEEEYLLLIEEYIKRANRENYYVHMAVAWLIAEILIKCPEFGKKILSDGYLDRKTQNKAIQKARESYRISNQEKERLNTLKK